ncbi:MAG TPA: hypothetical protein VF614_03285 [Chthoniobacteraceae bacterium]|jgi:hypothetical protein
MSSPRSFFTELGRTVFARWKAENFSHSRFSEIAVAALEERPPAEHVSVADLIREFLLDDEQPFQTSSGFGQPELVVYDHPRFYIQILFWLEGTTDIHQHMFSGAFHVLAGSSLHARFDFEQPQPISAHLQLGDLRMKEMHLLETGTTVPIFSGSGYIHSLFHLETPSLTVVVRTHTDPGAGPQFTYLPPHVALDPFHDDALTTRRKQLLDVLERTGDASYPELVAQMIETLDFERGFFVLQNCLGHLRNLSAWDEIWSIFQERHGALAARVGPTLDEIIWRDTLVGLRSTVTDADHRFFLALLLNVHERTQLLEFVEHRFPEADPAETIAGWVEELAEESELGTWILDAEFPVAAGAEGEDQPAVLAAALRHFLAGDPANPPPELAQLPAGALVEIRTIFARSALRALVA